MANSDDLCVRDVLQQSSDRVYRRTFYLFLYFFRFQHLVKLAKLVKLLRTCCPGVAANIRSNCSVEVPDDEVVFEFSGGEVEYPGVSVMSGLRPQGALGKCLLQPVGGPHVDPVRGPEGPLAAVDEHASRYSRELRDCAQPRQHAGVIPRL